jgi:hypothetical protein
VLDDVDLHRAEFNENCLWMAKFIALRKGQECWNIFQKWNIIKALET